MKTATQEATAGKPRPSPQWLGRDPALADVAAPSAPRGAYVCDEAVAVLVAHGMGQQVRFEALEQAAGVLQRSLQSCEPVVLRRVRLGAQEVTRAEVSFADEDGRSRQVHVYELYWAPLTEGRVNLRDVIGFLWEGAKAGLRHAIRRRFDRYLFGTRHRFRIELTSAAAFLAAAGILGALMLMNAVLLAMLSSGVFFGGGAPWPTAGLVADFTIDLALFLGIVVVCMAGGVGFPAWLHARVAQVPRAVTGAGWVLVALAVLSTVVAGALLALQLWQYRESGAGLFWPSWLHDRVVGELPPRSLAQFARLGVIWGGAVYVSYRVRHLLVQYVGDVAAYVSGHKVSRFDELREQIRKTSCDVARAVYQASGDTVGGFAYGRVVVLGHSLGSVIAYDMLNALIREDGLAPAPCFVADRTALLLTFGSPLDKTAFIFRSQARNHLDIREASAATVQPLIESYSLRPRRWVNLHTPNDWICGSLEYYDDPEDPGFAERGVVNEVDEEATTPLAAHGEYWSGRRLARHLARAVRGTSGEGAARTPSRPGIPHTSGE